MTTVTGLTAERMLAIEAASVVDGDVVGNNLILTKHDGTQINAGVVVGPTGPAGPAGSDLAVLASKNILEVGMANQIRAGRQLTATDFTNMGLSAPLGLWNLSDLTDASGNGRPLLNKGAVPFDTGINGVATTAAKFVSSIAQALYIADTGAADPFRIKQGTWGCWFRSDTRVSLQMIFAKDPTTAASRGWSLYVSNGILSASSATADAAGNGTTVVGLSDVCDERWHFGVAVFDGAYLRLYVDGILESTIASPYPTIFACAAPLNIGARAADGSTAASSSFGGRVDEAFVTSDVLTDDQIRNLYCAKIAHTLAAVPKRASVSVRRRRRGAALVAGDFPTQPIRLHNFSAGSLADEGSGNVALTNTNAAVSVPGADGSLGNAFNFILASSQMLSSTDTGLPAGTASRSFGCWFKVMPNAASMTLMGWGGALGANDIRLLVLATGVIAAYSGADAANGIWVTDGQWHFAVVTEENAPADGVKRKLYLDGRLIGISITLTSTTLTGAGGFKIGNNPAGASAYLMGQIDTVFVCNYVLTVEQILALYVKGSQALGVSPVNAGDNIELMTTTDLYCIFDGVDSQNQIDLAVA